MELTIVDVFAEKPLAGNQLAVVRDSGERLDRGVQRVPGRGPATLETGAIVQVPLFVNQGELIKIDTRSGKYVSRAKD